jgi:hypothetical protein
MARDRGGGTQFLFVGFSEIVRHISTCSWFCFMWLLLNPMHIIDFVSLLDCRAHVGREQWTLFHLVIGIGGWFSTKLLQIRQMMRDRGGYCMSLLNLVGWCSWDTVHISACLWFCFVWLHKPLESLALWLFWIAALMWDVNTNTRTFPLSYWHKMYRGDSFSQIGYNSDSWWSAEVLMLNVFVQLESVRGQAWNLVYSIRLLVG